MAQVQNVVRVVLQAGNSPKTTFSNDRELVNPMEAMKWLAIPPAQPANIIQVPTSVVAPGEVAAATA